MSGRIRLERIDTEPHLHPGPLTSDILSGGARRLDDYLASGGHYIVFQSNRGGSLNLRRIDADGNNPKRLTEGGGETTTQHSRPTGVESSSSPRAAVATDCMSVDLRAERDGSKNGRVYWVYFQVRDAAGNMQTVKAKVDVPKNQGAGSTAVDDTPASPAQPPYKVMGTCRQ